jgi:hypothetical protein
VQKCGLKHLLVSSLSRPIAGAIYDIRQLYDDVFYVVGALYVLDAIIFACIPALDWWRRYTGQTTYDDIAGLGTASAGQQTHTVKVPQRSVSRGSLANEADGVIAGDAANGTSSYGSVGAQNGYAPTYLNNRGVGGGGGGGGSTNPHNPFKSQAMGDAWKPNNLETEQSNLSGGGPMAYGSREQSIPLQSMPPQHYRNPYD